MKKIIKGDEVIVIAGKDKGKIGRVLRVLGDFFVVEKVNIIKKAVKPNPNINEPGGIVAKEGKIHISNVAIYNSETQKKDRVIFKIEDVQDNEESKKKKIRLYKSTGKLIVERGN